MINYPLRQIISLTNIERVIGKAQIIDCEHQSNPSTHCVRSGRFDSLKFQLIHYQNPAIAVSERSESNRLGLVDDFRIFDWVSNIKYPTLIFQKSNIYLSNINNSSSPKALTS